jgi:hypothetical protein
MLVDGLVAGIWNAKRKTKTVDVTIEPFVRLIASRLRELNDEAERIATFLEIEPSLTIGSVLGGAHA